MAWKHGLQLPRTTEDLRRKEECIEEMVQHTLYVFGGQHTQQGLVINIVHAIKVDKPIPEIWLRWPCSIYALPGDFQEFALQLDTLGELDNEAIALKVDLRSRVARFTQRFRAEFKNYQAWVEASPQVKRAFVERLATTIPGKFSRTADFIV